MSAFDFVECHRIVDTTIGIPRDQRVGIGRELLKKMRKEQNVREFINEQFADEELSETTNKKKSSLIKEVLEYSNQKPGKSRIFKNEGRTTTEPSPIKL